MPNTQSTYFLFVSQHLQKYKLKIVTKNMEILLKVRQFFQNEWKVNYVSEIDKILTNSYVTSNPLNKLIEVGSNYNQLFANLLVTVFFVFMEIRYVVMTFADDDDLRHLVCYQLDSFGKAGEQINCYRYEKNSTIYTIISPKVVSSASLASVAS